MGKPRAVEKDTITVDAEDWEEVELDVEEGETLHLFAAVDVSMDSQLDISIYVLSAKYVFEDTFYPEHAYFAAERIQSIDRTIPIRRAETVVVVFDNRYSMFTEKEVNLAIELMGSDKVEKRSRKAAQSGQIPSKKETAPIIKRQFLGLPVSIWLFVVVSVGVALALVAITLLLFPSLLPAVGPFIAILTLLINIGNWWRGRKSHD